MAFGVITGTPPTPLPGRRKRESSTPDLSVMSMNPVLFSYNFEPKNWVGGLSVSRTGSG